MAAATADSRYSCRKRLPAPACKALRLRRRYAATAASGDHLPLAAAPAGRRRQAADSRRRSRGQPLKQQPGGVGGSLRFSSLGGAVCSRCLSLWSLALQLS